MHIQISLNPSHESDRITAFLTQLACYEHDVVIVVNSTDLVEQEQPAAMDNLQISRHHLSFVDRVIYLDGDTMTTLYERPVNKDGIWRKHK